MRERSSERGMRSREMSERERNRDYMVVMVKMKTKRGQKCKLGSS